MLLRFLIVRLLLRRASDTLDIRADARKIETYVRKGH